MNRAKLLGGGLASGIPDEKGWAERIKCQVISDQGKNLNQPKTMNNNTRRWPSVMVDLETLGTSAKAAVIEMGAVCFDLETGEMGPRFETRLSLKSNEKSGRAIEAETLAWWMARWSESGRVPDLSCGNTVEGAWWDFDQFWKKNADPTAEFWSRGSFDEVILRDMAVGLGGEPWRFWNVRDQRTVMAWEETRRHGEPSHSAVEDAVGQVGALFALAAKKRKNAETLKS